MGVTGAAVGLNIDIIIKNLTTLMKCNLDPEITLKVLMALSQILVNSADTLALVPNRSQVINKLIKGKW